MPGIYQKFNKSELVWTLETAHLSWMLELLEWWDWRLEPREEHTDDWDEDTLDSLGWHWVMLSCGDDTDLCWWPYWGPGRPPGLTPAVWLRLAPPPSLLPRPLSVLVVEFLQPELAPEPTVTEELTESWPGDCRSGESRCGKSEIRILVNIIKDKKKINKTECLMHDHNQLFILCTADFSKCRQTDYLFDFSD